MGEQTQKPLTAPSPRVLSRSPLARGPGWRVGPAGPHRRVNLNRTGVRL